MSRSQVFMELFTWTKTRVFLKAQPQNWFADKRTWPKHGDQQQQADAHAGLHADHVMFVLDDVCVAGDARTDDGKTQRPEPQPPRWRPEHAQQ